MLQKLRKSNIKKIECRDLIILFQYYREIAIKVFTYNKIN